MSTPWEAVQMRFPGRLAMLVAAGLAVAAGGLAPASKPFDLDKGPAAPGERKAAGSSAPRP